MKVKVSDYVMQFLATERVKHVFALSGGGCMHLIDSLGRSEGLEYVCCLHEQAAGIAAAAYAQYTSNIGVALVTTGPGSTNAITGTAGCWIESIPAVFISGQVKCNDISGEDGPRMLGFQEIDIVPMVKPVTKYAVTITDASDIRYHLEKAFYLAREGRQGPVWLDIPLDVQATLVEEESLRGFEEESAEINTNVAKEKIQGVVELINDSKRPVIIAGAGIKMAGAKKEFRELVEKLKIPVLTTWKACELLPEDHQYYFGRPGPTGQRAANFVQQNADLVISIGARLDFGQIGFDHSNFARCAKKVMVDIDALELEKMTCAIDIPIDMSADMFIEEMVGRLKDVAGIDITDWAEQCSSWKDAYPPVIKEFWDKKDYVSTYALVDTLSDCMTSTDVFAPGSSGSCSDISMQALRVKEGQVIQNMPGWGSMGFGIPCALGVGVASGKRIICINGDGGLQHNIQDLESISRLNLPVKLFILNNVGYGSIKAAQDNHFGGFHVASDPGSGVTLPESCDVAKTYKFKYIKIETNQELGARVNEVLDTEGPVLCEVFVDPEEKTMPKMRSEVKEDGSIVSKPIEDLWPYLDREEFKKNMLIGTLAE